MRAKRVVLSVLLWMGLMAPLAQAASVPGLSAQQLPDIVAPLLDAVVNISVLRPHAGARSTGGEDLTPPDRSVGSGFVISDDGFIVTNDHVVSGAYSVTVAFNDGKSYPAKIVATNKRPDIALLKIDAGHPLKSVSFGDSDTLRIAEPVIAIGNPVGLSSSVTVGVISALNRDISLSMIDDFIQTDAAINRGNSGGPLFNLKGEVIGVNSALYATTTGAGSAGLGFAIPSRDASWVVDQMRKNGRVHAGFLGVRIQQITGDIETALGLSSRNGGIIVGVLPDTPAAAAGLSEGDIILTLNGREPRDVRALLRDLGTTPPGGKISLRVSRNGAQRSLDLVAAEWPSGEFDPVGAQPQRDRGARQDTGLLGLKLAAADASALDASPFFKGRKSVFITGVAANSPAADAGLMAGNLILEVSQTPVTTPEDVGKGIDDARVAGHDSVLILSGPAGDPHWIVVPIK